MRSQSDTLNRDLFRGHHEQTIRDGYAERIEEPQQTGLKGLDRNVKVLGVVALLNDLSSEVTVRTLPLFLANVLGVGTAIIGFIEGIAETTATLLKIVSGTLSDRLGKKKGLTLWGYGLQALPNRCCISLIRGVWYWPCASWIVWAKECAAHQKTRLSLM